MDFLDLNPTHVICGVLSYKYTSVAVIKVKLLR